MGGSPIRGRSVKRYACTALVLAAIATASANSRAQSAPQPAAGAPAPTSAQDKAEQHYQRARDLYASGAYREAAAELEAARALDPNAKELVFNLGIVSEKLGKIDDALRYFRLYAQMEGTTSAEKQKAEAFLRRLEGAKREVVVAPAPPPPPPPAGPQQPPKPPSHGRVDAATITAASVAVLGVGIGAAFGIKALADKPTSGYVTGNDGTYQNLQDAQRRAHSEAIVSDVGFGAGLVAAVVAAYLYFGRTRVTVPLAARQGCLPNLVASPAPGGGGLVLQGTF